MSQTRKVRKAVFPVAGLGTRFLPATKAVPKEMLTVVDKPVIQYVVDEALDAGIEHLIFVTGRSKAVIEDYFDIQVELEQTLRERNKTAELTLLESILPVAGSTSFTRQQSPLGLGHAVWCARELVGDEPFALLLPDMIMQAEKGCLKGMVELYEQSGGNVIAVEECAPDQTHKYGIVGAGGSSSSCVGRMASSAECPEIRLRVLSNRKRMWLTIPFRNGIRLSFQALSTIRWLPLLPVTLMRLPAGRSGPLTGQVVASSRIRPRPSTIGCSRTAVRPMRRAPR